MDKGDARILEKLREGDAETFTAVLNRFQKKVKGYCEAKAPPDGRADDLAQQTFVKFFELVRSRRLGAFESCDDLEHLMMLIAIRQLIDDARKETAELRKLERYGAYRVIRESRPDEILLSNEAEKLVLREVVRLDPQLREIYLLSSFEDMTTKQMAKTLDLPLWIVQRRLRIGKATLSEGLTTYFKGVVK
jgi:RNA polymerase sigma-70 factor (ECF subfamily)